MHKCIPYDNGTKIFVFRLVGGGVLDDTKRADNIRPYNKSFAIFEFYIVIFIDLWYYINAK